MIGADAKDHEDGQVLCILALLLIGCSIQESWSHLSLVAVLWRVGPSPPMSSIIELVLVAGVWVGQPQVYECGKADPSNPLL